MNPRMVYKLQTWKPRALKRAKSLEGRPLLPREQEILDGFGVEAYFMAFGIQPETQKYIDFTIQVLEQARERYIGQLLTMSVRLRWSCEALLNDGCKDPKCLNHN